MGAAFALAALVIGRYAMISQQNYEIQCMKANIETLNEEQTRLLTELASAQDLGMVLNKAQELGLQNPTQDQLCVVENAPQAPVMDEQPGTPGDVIDAGQDASWWTQIMRRLFG
nr:hypothetical protein [bacterium]